jgi:hypothetical protein
VRHERPPHTPGTHHRRDHHPGEHLSDPLVERAPLPLCAEEEGVAEATAADGDRLEELTVVILRCHGYLSSALHFPAVTTCAC